MSERPFSQKATQVKRVHLEPSCYKYTQLLRKSSLIFVIGINIRDNGGLQMPFQIQFVLKKVSEQVTAQVGRYCCIERSTREIMEHLGLKQPGFQFLAEEEEVGSFECTFARDRSDLICIENGYYYAYQGQHV